MKQNDHYVTELRKLVSTCEFSNPEEILRDQVALNIKDKKGKERLMIEAQTNYRLLTLNKDVAIVKSYEALYASETIGLQHAIPMELNKANKTVNKY